MSINSIEEDSHKVRALRPRNSARPTGDHCPGIDVIAEAIEAGVDTIEHCTFMNEAMDPDPDPAILERLASSGIPVSASYGKLPGAPVPEQWTALVPKIRYATAHVLGLGGRVVLGSDAGITEHKPHDVAPNAIANFLDLGLSPERALQAMTADGADLDVVRLLADKQDLADLLGGG